MGNEGPASAAVPSSSISVDAPWLRTALSTVKPDGSVTSVEPIEAGGRRPILAVRFAEADPIVVRHGDDAAALATEIELLSTVATETTVPVATPLGWGPSYVTSSGSARSSATDATADGTETAANGIYNGGWLATEFVAGDDLHEAFVALDPVERRDLAAAFGRILAELHAAFRFGGYGPLVAVDGELRAASRSSSDGHGRAAAWRDWLVDRGRERLDRLPSAFDAVGDAARARLDAWTVETAPTPRLFPWDLRPGNALVTDAEIAAIVDWESPLAAGAALSVAKADYLVADWYVPDEAAALRRAFRAGYAEVRPVPTVEDVHRIVAIAETAVDSRGVVTNPEYPPVGRDEAVAFHRRHLADAT